MRALIIEPAGNLWGSERALLDLLDNLHGDHFAICMPPGKPLRAELDRRGFRIFPYYIYALHEKTKLHRLCAAIGVLIAAIQYRPDIIYMNQSGAYKIVLPTAYLLRRPIVAHIRIFEDVPYLARLRPNPRIVKRLIAISQAIFDGIRAQPLLASIPCTLIIDAYKPHDDPKSEIVRRGDHIACVGRIVPNKGQDLLLAAVAVLTREMPKLKCHFAGNDQGAFAHSLKAYELDRQLAPFIVWEGIVDDSVSLLRSVALMIVPSHNEALGRVIFEAWEAGAVPVACRSSGGAAEIIKAADYVCR